MQNISYNIVDQFKKLETNSNSSNQQEIFVHNVQNSNQGHYH